MPSQKSYDVVTLVTVIAEEHEYVITNNPEADIDAMEAEDREVDAEFDSEEFQKE